MGMSLPYASLAEMEVWADQLMASRVTGPIVREWGFDCPQGWRHWTEYTKGEGHTSGVGRGCGE